MKLLPRKALLVVLSLGMPPAHTSDTDSSSCNKFKVALRTLAATAAALVATKAVYNRCYRFQNKQEVQEAFHKEVEKHESDLKLAEKNLCFTYNSKHDHEKSLPGFCYGQLNFDYNYDRKLLENDYRNRCKKTERDCLEAICRLECEQQPWPTLKRLRAFLSWR